MRVRLLVAAVVSLLSGCGGGGSSDSEPRQPEPQTPPLPSGLYGIHVSDMDQDGNLLVGADGAAFFTSRQYAGFGTFQGSARITLHFLDHPIDDLNNEFPSAKDAVLSKELNLSPASNGVWTGSSATLNPLQRPAPDIASLPRNWHFRNLYRFGGSTFLDYTAQFDISVSGDLSGFDTNGCVFTGALSPAGEGGLYPIRINASNCGATLDYIDNYSYEGLGYISENPTALTIVAVNTSARQGVAFRLSPRQ